MDGKCASSSFCQWNITLQDLCIYNCTNLNLVLRFAGMNFAECYTINTGALADKEKIPLWSFLAFSKSISRSNSMHMWNVLYEIVTFRIYTENKLIS